MTILLVAVGGGMIFIAAANDGSTAFPMRRRCKVSYIRHPHTLPADDPMLQSDLFERPLVAGLAFKPDLITREVESELIARIDAIDLAPFRFQGWLGKRVTASFGWRYDFDNASFGPTEPIPDWLLPIRNNAAAFAGLAPDKLVQVLLTRYDPGAGIGWHRDRPVFEHVVGISLGVPATMRFRKRKASGFDRANVPLPPRSAYHLSGEVRYEWEHSIAEMDVTRWSITFRSLSAKGLAALDR